MRRITHGTERRGRGALRATALLTLLTALLVAPATAGAVAPGGFNQLANPLGCLTDGGAAGTCTSTHDLTRSLSHVLSPDGKNLYVASIANHSIEVFDRNAATGALTQKSGNQGCIKNGAATATCRAATGMLSPVGLAITPDGRTVYVASNTGNAVLTFTRDTATGALTQKAGALGCMSNGGNGVTCRDARALGGPGFITITANGKHMYVTGSSTDSVTAFAIASDGTLTQLGDGSGGSGCIENVVSADGCGDGRALDQPFSINASSADDTIYVAAFTDASVVALGRDPATGRLSQLGGTTGCADSTGTDGCATVTDLAAPRDVVGAPGGKHIYVAASTTNKVILFDRLASGGLVRRAGLNGCIGQSADAACRAGRGMGSPSTLAVSPGGEDVYVASRGSNSGLVELDRNTSTGVLTPRPGTRGCIVAGAAANCASATQLSAMYQVRLSPDGRHLYVGSFTVPVFGVFKRDSSGPVCSDAGQTVTQGTLTTLTLTCSDPDGDPVSFQIVTPPTIGGLGLISGKQVGYAASQGQCGTTVFAFRGTSSGQTSANRAFTLNIVGCTGPGPGPGPGPPDPLTVLPSTTSINSLAFTSFTKLVNLSVKNLMAGSTVVVTCKTKKKKQQKKGCAYKRKRFTTSGARAKLNLRKPFAKTRLPVGTKITITISAPNFIGKQIQYTVRKRKIPKSRVRCIPPGGKARSCG